MSSGGCDWSMPPITAGANLRLQKSPSQYLDDRKARSSARLTTRGRSDTPGRMQGRCKQPKRVGMHDLMIWRGMRRLYWSSRGRSNPLTDVRQARSMDTREASTTGELGREARDSSIEVRGRCNRRKYWRQVRLTNALRKVRSRAE